VEEKELLAAVAAATQARKEAKELLARLKAERAAAIRAADDAGVPREAIARAAGAKWPQSYSGWSQLRGG